MKQITFLKAFAKVTVFLLFAMSIGVATAWAQPVPFSFSRIYIEYNASANDLGYHVTLDGEDWTRLKIKNPNNKVIFNVQGKGPYKDLGMTELFFEGAEPSLFDFPLADLLALFPEGEYNFKGRTADGEKITGISTLSHAVPAGPDVSASDDTVGTGNVLVIRWDPVTTVATDPAGGTFPDLPINVVAYQVIVEDFLLTIPATVPPAPMSVAVPPEYIATLPSGTIPFEVLAIDQSGNQTLTEGTFTK
jgi:hypothetical protein